MKKLFFLLFAALAATSCITYPAEIEPFDRISPASVKPKVYGPSVLIWRVEGVDEGPVAHVLASELARGGYSVRESGYRNYSSSYSRRGDLWGSYFPQNMGRGDLGDCRGCRVDYLVEIGARPIRTRSAGIDGSASRHGYGVAGSGFSAGEEVEIYITFYDGRTRQAVPGKSARKRERVGSFGRAVAEIATRAVGLSGLAESYSYDPWTEAAIRAIPQLIESEGRR